MPAEKISVTVDEQLMKWARTEARRRRITLSAMVSEALELRRQYDARERYLERALAGLSATEIERRSAKAFKRIFGQSDAPE